MSSIDLIITDQPNLFVDFGVHSFLDDQCQHQIIHDKRNISVPRPHHTKGKSGIMRKPRRKPKKTELNPQLQT